MSALQVSTRCEMVEVRRYHLANEIGGGAFAHGIRDRRGLAQWHEQRGLVVRDRRSPSFGQQQRSQCVSDVIEAIRFKPVKSYAVNTGDWRFLHHFDTHGGLQATFSGKSAKVIPS